MPMLALHRITQYLRLSDANGATLTTRSVITTAMGIGVRRYALNGTKSRLP